MERRKKPVTVFIDTHIAIWLYIGSADRLSAKGRNVLESGDILISPVCLMEIEYLYEIGKIKKQSFDIINHLKDAIDLNIDDVPLSELINYAIRENWTRDPFDRMIVAHAKKRNSYLISADRTIRKHYKKTLI